MTLRPILSGSVLFSAFPIVGLTISFYLIRTLRWFYLLEQSGSPVVGGNWLRDSWLCVPSLPVV